MDPASRISEIDMIRGFALFGVLLVNMFGFGAEWGAWESPIDRLAFTIMRVFFDSKSWTLFSLLFGFGFAIQLLRADRQGYRFLPMYLRRLVVLFLIGSAHALLYDGDILMLYAELGVALLFVHRLSTRTLLIAAAALIFVFPLAHLVTPERQPGEPGATATVEVARAALEEAQRTHVYATGSFADVVIDNASAIPANPFEDINWADSGLAVFAMFLLGLSIGRSGILNNIAAHGELIARVRNWGLASGLLAMAVERWLAATTGYAVFRVQQAGLGAQFLGDLVFAFGTVALALGYGALIVVAAQTRTGRAMLAPLGAVGRLGLTVYLTQTLIFSTLFYGYGLGQAYQLGPAAVTACAVVIFAVQVLACQWWLKRFRYGPAEWIWRSLTYLKWEPLRRRPGLE
jgi:uncharacterized protein